MIKLVAPAGWNFDQSILSSVSLSTRGLVGHDRAQFLKRASHSFLPLLDNIKFAKDEVPVHLIALGASEAYGPNRNGDGFKAAACRKYHNTFVKFGKFFRNHKNKPERGDPHFGVIKASAYNEDMRRVELLCALNAEKSATERNGGFIADAELEKLARGADIPVSMACRVPRDVCSYCQNSARTRDEYCTTEKCAAGGCRDNLSRLIKVGNDLHHLHVDNPDPTWFDISAVFRPADRIAYGAKADYLTKAAADNGLFELQDAIKLAEASSVPLAVVLQAGQTGFWNPMQISQIQLGYGLAAIEKFATLREADMYRALVMPAFPVEKLATFGSARCDAQLATLADYGIILPLPAYATLIGQDAYTKQAAAVMPWIYTQMADSEALPQSVERGACLFAEKHADERAGLLAAGLQADFSLKKAAVTNRLWRSCIQGQPVPVICAQEKSAGCSAEGHRLAQQYAMYKLGSLWRLAATDSDFPLTVRLSVRQNLVFN